jgi:hypothetical protein
VDKVVISQVSTESEEEDDNGDSDKPAENGTAIEEKTKEVTNESRLEEDQAELSPDGETNETAAEDDLSEQSPTESVVPVTPANNKKVQQLVETIDEESALSDLPMPKASDQLGTNSIPSFQSEDVSMAGSQDGIHGEESGTGHK